MHRYKKVAGGILALAVATTSTTLLAGPAEAAPPSRIKGVVTADGVPLPNVEVTTWALVAGAWVSLDSDVTGLDGKYNVGKLDDGTYRVRFDDLTGAYATEFHLDASRIEDAEDVQLVDGTGMRTLPDPDLQSAAHVLGTVTGGDGKGLGGAEVTAYVVQGAAWASFRTVLTGADGTYDLGGLPGGDYTLGFRDPVSGVTEYWNDKEALGDAGTVTVPTSERHDAQLATPIPAPDPVPMPVPTAVPVAEAPTTATAPTVAPAAAVTVLKKPRIKGHAKVGQRLRVTTGTWNPGKVRRTIQWFADGKRVKGATKNRLRLTGKLTGKRISARVIASAPGRTPLKVTTRKTKKVNA
jgi:5-hydroxyisourate hydrolase-like protein (transthyretin family)